MCDHLTQCKDKHGYDENPGIRRNGQHAHTDGSHGDPEDHRGKYFRVFDDAGYQQLQKYDGPGVHGGHMLGFKFPVGIAHKQTKESIDDPVDRRHIDFFRQVPQHRIVDLEIHDPEPAVNDQHQDEAVIFKHAEHFGDHLYDGLITFFFDRFFKHEKVEQIP